MSPSSSNSKKKHPQTTQLHLLCHIPGVSLQKIESVINSRPAYLATKDADGRLPLHVACKASRYHHPCIIQSIMDAFPQALAVKLHGKLPLIIMLENCGRPESIAICVSRYPQALQVKNTGMLPLHVLLQHIHTSKTAALVKLFLKKYPASVEIATGTKGWTPLHVASYYKQPLSVLKVLVEAYPQALKARDDELNLPLHLAASKHPNVHVVEYLTSCYPRSIQKINRHGNLPLHFAVQRVLSKRSYGKQHLYPLDVLQHLLQMYPEGLTTTNNNHKIPLELALEPARVHVVKQDDNLQQPRRVYVFPQSLEVLKVLIASNPLTLSQKLKGSGMLPLHYAISLTGLCPPQTQEQQAQKEAGKGEEGEQEHAHHSLQADIDSKNSWMKSENVKDDSSIQNNNNMNDCTYCGLQRQLLEFIMEAHPPTLHLQHDTTGETALHHACRYHGDRLDIIELLLKYFPEGATVRDFQGNLPLFLLAESGFASLDVILCMVEYSLSELFV